MRKLAVALAFVFVSVGVARTNMQPNILLIMTDDMRADTSYAPWMPSVQALRDNGLDFPLAFANTSLCCPARATVFTGLYSHNHQILGNEGYSDPDFDHSDPGMLPLELKGVGYSTALFGKYMLATGMNRPPGWDRWHVFTQNGNDGSLRLYYDYNLNENGAQVSYGNTSSDYSTDVLRDKAAALIAEWTTDEQPWFIEVGFYAPHKVAHPANRHLGAWSSLGPWRPPNYRESISDKPPWLGWWVFLNGDDSERISQLESLLAVDEAVQKLIDTLAMTGQLNNTLVIFTSDGGMHWGEHWHENKASPYEESIKIPLVMHWPDGIAMPRVASQAMVSNTDLYATMLEVAGAQPASHNGKSLVPLFSAAAGCSFGERAVLFEHFGTGNADPHHGVRTRRWKYIETRDEIDPSSPVTFRELYDLANDPYELDNILVADPTWQDDPNNATILAGLQNQLQQQVAR